MREGSMDRLPAADGNVYNLAGYTMRTLERAGKSETVNLFLEDLAACDSFHQAYILALSYISRVEREEGTEPVKSIYWRPFT